MRLSAQLPPSLAEQESFNRQAARDSNVSDAQLRKRPHRITQGWYTPEPPPDLLTRCQAITPALPPDAVFSDTTAVQLWNLPLPYLSADQQGVLSQPLHVTVPPRPVIPRRKELVVHQRTLSPADICVLEGVSVIVPSRLLIDLAPLWKCEFVVALGDALLREGHAPVETLYETVNRLAGRRGAGLARQIIPLLDARAQSPPESILRIRLAQAGILLEPQCPIFNINDELIGHVDLGDRRGRVAVEYEGRQHAEGEQFDRDIDRYTEFSAEGWLIVRAGRRDLAGRSERLIQRVQQALANAKPLTS